MHRFNSHISQFLRKMRALIFLYVNKDLTDITTKHKMIAICKTKKFAKLRQISFLHVQERNSQINLYKIDRSEPQNIG